MRLCGLSYVSVCGLGCEVMQGDSRVVVQGRLIGYEIMWNDWYEAKLSGMAGLDMRCRRLRGLGYEVMQVRFQYEVIRGFRGLVSLQSRSRFCSCIDTRSKNSGYGLCRSLYHHRPCAKAYPEM